MPTWDGGSAVEEEHGGTVHPTAAGGPVGRGGLPTRWGPSWKSEGEHPPQVQCFVNHLASYAVFSRWCHIFLYNSSSKDTSLQTHAESELSRQTLPNWIGVKSRRILWERYLLSGGDQQNKLVPVPQVKAVLVTVP